MLTNETAAVVMEALSDITLNPDQSFTAYDITKAARSLTDENVRHSDVRELIHALYDHSFLTHYDRFPHTFWTNGRQETAQLFCPVTGDPNDYDPEDIQLIKQNAAQAAIKGALGNNPLIQGATVMVSTKNGFGVTGCMGLPIGLTDPSALDEEEEQVIDASSFTPITKAKPYVSPNPSSNPIKIDPLKVVKKIKDRLSKLPRFWR